MTEALHLESILDALYKVGSTSTQVFSRQDLGQESMIVMLL